MKETGANRSEFPTQSARLRKLASWPDMVHRLFVEMPTKGPVRGSPGLSN